MAVPTMIEKGMESRNHAARMLKSITIREVLSRAPTWSAGSLDPNA
jgi:hypothetical protein